MKIKHLMPKILLGSIATIAFFIIITIVINLSIFDEKLDQKLVELLKPVELHEDETNAYLALWGLHTANDKNMIKTGKALVTRYRNNRDAKGIDDLSSDDYREILGGTEFDNDWKKQIGHCNARKNHNCTSQLSLQLINKPIYDIRLNLMLERYQQVIGMSDFQQIIAHTFTSPLPEYGTLLKLKRIKQANSYLSSDVSQFIDDLETELKFWKMLLDKGNSLIDKMIAIVAIWGDLHTISEYVNEHSEISEQDLSKLQALVSPLTKGELDIGEAFIFEQRAFNKTLRIVDSEHLIQFYGLTGKFFKIFIQPNATINDYNEYFTQALVRMSKLPVNEFYNTVKKSDNDELSCCFKEVENLLSISPSSLYNLGGKSLLPYTTFQAQDYIGRVHDLNGMLTLLRLKFALKNVAQPDVKDAILNSKERNPYTGKAMDFDNKTRTLGFECFDKDSFCKVVL